MKSRIKFDVVDLNGSGMEPVIKVELNSSDDPRDKMLNLLFQGSNGTLKITFINSELDEEQPSISFKSTILLHN